MFQQFSAPITYTAGTGLTESPTYTFNIGTTGVTANTYGSASQVPVFAVNARGQLTSVTNTAIAINGSAVSGNITGSAGSVANALTLGTYLTGTSYNGSSAVTAAVDATSTNTVSKVVARDSSGNFAAGTITAALSGNATTATTATNTAGGAANQISYNTAAGTTSYIVAPTVAGTYLNWNGSAFAYSALSLPNSLTINNGGAGGASGSTFNGSAALTISYNTVGAPSTGGTGATGTWGISISGSAASATSATSATTATNLAGGSAGTIPYQSAAGTTVQLAAGTSTYLLQSNGAAAPSWVAPVAAANNGALTMAVSGTGLSGSASFTANQAGASSFTVTSNATSANTASTIVARDASGNFTAGTITAALSGNATTATTAANVNNGTLTLAVSGTGLSGSQTFTANQSTAATFTVTSNATNANTASTIVARDGSGNFSAGTITAALSGNATTSSSTTGNAATATALSSGQGNWVGTGVIGNVVGMLAWKNYNNGHVIFDASAGTSPSGGAVNNTNSAVAWSSTYPTLMGWNGSSTYGVRVDSARVADSASNVNNGTLTLNVSGTGLSGSQTFTANQSGNATFTVTSNATSTAGAASTIVARDTNGYIFNTYFNSTDNSVASGVTAVMVKSGDSYLRSGTAAAIATFISGQSMNISGSSTSCSGNAATATTATNQSGGTVNATSVSASSYVQVVGTGTITLSNTGDITASRSGGTTGVIFLNSAQTRYLYNDGTNYQMPLGGLQINSLGVGTTPSGTTGEIRATNNITAYYSDDRLKTRLGKIENALDKVKTLDSFYYEANQTAQDLGYTPVREVGISAQQVQAIMPEVVVPAPIDDKYLTVRYERLVPLLLAAINELEAKVANLENKGKA